MLFSGGNGFTANPPIDGLLLCGPGLLCPGLPPLRPFLNDLLPELINFLSVADSRSAKVIDVGEPPPEGSGFLPTILSFPLEVHEPLDPVNHAEERLDLSTASNGVLADLRSGDGVSNIPKLGTSAAVVVPVSLLFLSEPPLSDLIPLPPSVLMISGKGNHWAWFGLKTLEFRLEDTLKSPRPLESRTQIAINAPRNLHDHWPVHGDPRIIKDLGCLFDTIVHVGDEPVKLTARVCRGSARGKDRKPPNISQMDLGRCNIPVPPHDPGHSANTGDLLGDAPVESSVLPRRILLPTIITVHTVEVHLDPPGPRNDSSHEPSIVSRGSGEDRPPEPDQNGNPTRSRPFVGGIGIAPDPMPAFVPSSGPPCGNVLCPPPVLLNENDISLNGEGIIHKLKGA